MVGLVLCLAQETALPGADLTRYEVLTLCFLGTAATANLLLALLALFGPQLKQWWFRPKLEIAVGRAPPFTEQRKIEVLSGVLSQQLDIRIRISNTGATSARQCQAYAEALYQKAANGAFYETHTFVPRHFRWPEEEPNKAILVSVSAYLTVARIIELQQHTTADTPTVAAPPQAQYSLHVALERPDQRGSLIEITGGCVAIPITLFAENMRKSVTRVVEVTWKGTSPDDVDPAHFSFELHTQEQFRTMKGEMP